MNDETLECHAFLCTKRKMAQAVTLTVAQAFKVAFEFWQVSRDGKEKREKSGSDGEGTSSSQSEGSSSITSLKGATGNLLDLGEATKIDALNASDNHFEDIFGVGACNENNNVVWELDDGLDEAFSRLAESRTNPQVLDIGVTENDIQPEDCFSPTTWDRMELHPADGDDLFMF